jgi:serine phosphatase RsbU (regulator of sigma subunit)
MANLRIDQGPNAGQRFALDREISVIGRLADAAICLPSHVVSRRHAQVVCVEEGYLIEDLGSINGTVLNGQRIVGSMPLKNGDKLQICEFVLTFEEAPKVSFYTEANILAKVNATAENAELYADNPQQKLQTVLELARHLGQTLEQQPLLDKLLEHLLQLFPLADRGLVVLWEQDRLVVRAGRSRLPGEADRRFSRTVIREVLSSGAGILSEALHGDERFVGSQSVGEVAAVSLMCVPLLGHDRKPLGAIQLDCRIAGQVFDREHLRLLTTVSLQVAVVLENVALHALRAREEALRRELALGREIQLGFLPTDFALPQECDVEIFACLHPAREVSGDLYDFFPLSGGRLAFLVGDVSDKGVAAAMFMVKVQTLTRHLAAATNSPAATLGKLNAILVGNNPSSMFVTLALGIYNAGTGEVILASGGHPRPLLRRADGRVEEVGMDAGRLLGCFEGNPGASDVSLTLGRGETLILYSDGYTEAAAPASKKMLGLRPLMDILGGAQTPLPLRACAEKARRTVERFIGTTELQDDLTLLLLRRL